MPPQQITRCRFEPLSLVVKDGRSIHALTKHLCPSDAKPLWKKRRFGSPPCVLHSAKMDAIRIMKRSIQRYSSILGGAPSPYEFEILIMGIVPIRFMHFVKEEGINPTEWPRILAHIAMVLRGFPLSYFEGKMGHRIVSRYAPTPSHKQAIPACVFSKSMRTVDSVTRSHLDIAGAGASVWNGAGAGAAFKPRFKDMVGIDSMSLRFYDLPVAERSCASSLLKSQVATTNAALRRTYFRRS